MKNAASILVLLAFLGLGGLGVRAVWLALAAANPAVSASIVAASATLVVSVFSVLVSKALDRQAVLQKELRDKKVPVYEGVIKFFLSTSLSVANGDPPPDPAAVRREMQALTQELVIWASDDVLKALRRFRSLSFATADTSQDKFAVLNAAEDLFLAIRRDLGHPNKGLTRASVLGLVLDDAGAILAGQQALPPKDGV